MRDKLLAQAARRVSSEERRAQRHRRDREVRYGEDATHGAMEPLEAVARAEFRERLARLVMDLPDAEREAVVLRFYEGLDYAAMEASTGAAPAALRQRLSRGLARLRERLSAEGEGGASGWRALALGVAGELPERASAAAVASSGGALQLVVAAFLLVSGAWLATAFWPQRSSPEAAVEAHLPRPFTAAGDAQLAALTAPSEAARVAAEVVARSSPAPEIAAAEAPTVELRLVDSATGAPAEGERWYVIRTGDFDLSGRPMGIFFGGPMHPNSEPMTTGVTGPDGVVRFPLPEDDLVHLITERSERFARGSFAVEITEEEAVPAEIELTAGRALFGKVIDDEGEPFPGVVIVGYTYLGEAVTYGVSDTDGAYRIERLNNLPRSFKRVHVDGVSTGEVRATQSHAFELELWASVEEQRLRRRAPQTVPLHFRGGEEDVERNLRCDRWRRLSGVVIDSGGEPVEGAHVQIQYAATEAGDFASLMMGDVWSVPDTELGGAITRVDGSFDLFPRFFHLERDGVSQRQYVATTPDGRVAVLPCSSLGLGEEHTGIRIVLGESPVVRVKLFDPEGEIRQSSGAYAQPRLQLADGDHAVGTQVELVYGGERAELALWHDRLPQSLTGDVGGTLLMPGYEPVPLDFSGGAGELQATLRRRPSVPIIVEVIGAGAPFVGSLSLHVIYADLDGKPLEAADFNRLAGWQLRSDFMPDVEPGRSVDVLARSGEQAFLGVTMSCVFAQPPERTPVIPLGVLEPRADGGFEELRVEIEAPAWGTGPPDSATRNPLIHSPKSVLRLDLIDSDSGERLLPWSLTGESGGVSFRGSVDDVGDRGRFTVEPGQATLRLESRFHQPLELGPFPIRAGETLDLGQVAMTRREGVKVQFVQPDGTPEIAGRAAWIPASELDGRDLPPGTLTELSIARGGQCLLDPPVADVAWLLLSEFRPHHGGALQPVALRMSPSSDPDAEFVATVLPWRNVRFRVSGLTAPSLFSSEGLCVTDAAGLAPAARTRYDGSTPVHAYHGLRIPPGEWIIEPPDDSPLAFEPVLFTVPPDADSKEPLVVEIIARSAD